MLARLMGLPVISPRALYERMPKERTLVIDVNDQASWHAARVPGALHLDPSSFKVGDLPTDRDAVIVFYCSNPFCRKAPSAARRARGMGYHNALVMAAGINGWINESLPTDSGALEGSG